MALFRQHLAGILLFPIGMTVMVVPLSMLVLAVNTPVPNFLVRALGPPLAVAGMAVLLGGTLYWRQRALRWAEWSVLAPVLALGLVLALYCNTVAGNLFGQMPRNVLRPPPTLPTAGLYVAGLLIVCAGCAAVATGWMKQTFPRADTGSLKRELLAVAILIPFSLWPRTAAAGFSDWMGWGVGDTVAEAWAGSQWRLALRSGLALMSIVVPCVLIFLLLWRGQSAAVRRRGIAVVGMWIVISNWLGQMYRIAYQFDYDNWLQTVGIGVAAGALALAYVHGIVIPLWRRVHRSEQAGEPSGAATGPSGG